MFGRLDKFNGPIFRGAYIGGGGACIWDVNWVKYLRVHIRGGGGVYMGGILMGFYGIVNEFGTCLALGLHIKMNVVHNIQNSIYSCKICTVLQNAKSVVYFLPAQS